MYFLSFFLFRKREKRERKRNRTDTLSPPGNDEGNDVGEVNEWLPSATPPQSISNLSPFVPRGAIQ
jgi:hypothetical protein